MKISVVVLSKKSELNHFLLESLSFVDEILLIIDSSSVIPGSDPESISTTSRLKIFYRPLNNDFSAQRNFALQKAKGDWVLFVDDDEYIGSELRKEIIEVIDHAQFSGFLLKRQDVVYHQPLRHGETGNIKILRLGRRRSGRFNRQVHENWDIEGRVGELKSPLYHNKDHFISEFISRVDQYGRIDSKLLVLEGKPFSWFRLLVYPMAKFKLNYYFRVGFLDGLVGLFLAYLMAVQSLSIRVFQWESTK